MKAMRKFYVFGSAFFTFVIIVLILIYFNNVDLLILQMNFGFESGKFRGQYLEKGKVQILHTSNQNVQDIVTKEGNSDFCNDYGEKVLVNSQRSLFRWKDRVTDHAKRTSVQYSSAKIYLKSPGQVSVLKIVTRDRNGNRKEVGGDFWRVYILNKTFSNFVYMQDNLDGVYEGMFVFPAAGAYRMVCILEYSLWDAFRDPPSNWFRKGSFQGKFQPAGTLGLFHDFLDQRFFDVTIWCFDNASSTRSYISKKKVEKKLTQCININAACGYWENGLFRQFPSTNVHYKPLKKQTRYDSEGFQKLRTLLLYGDSHAIRYYKSLLDKPACSSIFLKCDYVFTFVYQRDKYRPILDDINYFDGKGFNKTIFLSDIKDAFYRDDMDSSESVIVINFGIHLMMTMSLNQAKDLFKEFLNIITTLRAKKKEREFPIVIWRTTPPPALENGKELRNATHTRFLTKQRVHLWNSFTINEACKAQLPVLNVHHMALAYYKGAVDHVHYKHEIFDSATESLIEYILQKTRRKRK